MSKFINPYDTLMIIPSRFAGFSEAQIGEILVFDGVLLTDAQITTVENYLTSKWGIS